MTRLTKMVNLTRAKNWPQHGWSALCGHPSLPSWKDWRGKPIRIYAKAKIADGWSCCTEKAWEVHPDSIAEIVPANMRHISFHVCEHQIKMPTRGSR